MAVSFRDEFLVSLDGLLRLPLGQSDDTIMLLNALNHVVTCHPETERGIKDYLQHYIMKDDNDSKSDR